MPDSSVANDSVRIFPGNWLFSVPLDEYFSCPAPIEVDVGCGKGRFLLARAAAHPDTNFLGIDRALRRIRKVDRKAVRRELHNIRLLRLDAYYATAYLMPPDSISTYYIFFPDPWPKDRHHRHRLFDAAFVDALHRTLIPDGVFHLATDHLPYFEEVCEMMRSEKRFVEIEPVQPAEDERTDFELLYKDIKQIGRCSFRRT